ncbi:uncharacterized protein LOC135247687 isoform X1 [Anguilla rostrata]|uniref:uncharacterized protein LOC135247687 isoform X1 n=1 Tax=Anguilla rostrata TaxID=7938 RepID=UPI0030D45344
MARRWLRPELRSADRVVELVTLERFIDGLPGETANWVRCHRPTGLAAAVTLAEDHLALYPRGQSQQQQQQQGRAETAPRRRAPPRSLPRSIPSSLPRAQTPSFSRNNPFFSVSPAPGSVATGFDPQRAPQTPRPGCWRCGQPGHLRRECPLMEMGQVVRVVGPPTSAPDPDGAYCIPVRIQGIEHQALLDSGAMQTMIQQSLVRPEALLEASRVSIRCVHGDLHEYPIVSVEIRCQGKKHKIKAAVSSRLSHPLILGTDWPGFRQAAGKVAGVHSRRVGLCDVCAAPPPGETPQVPVFRPMEDFPLEQSRDDTLRFAFDRVMSIYGQQVRPDATLTHPYFVIIRDMLYRVCRDTQTNEEITQLLVPKSSREMVFQTAHFNPTAGHLGYEKTLNRIMARFYWPGIWVDVRRWCASCPECQLVNSPAIPKAPLRPLPLMEVPFEREWGWTSSGHLIGARRDTASC